MDVEKMNRKELTDKELVKVSGGNGGGMDIAKAPPLEGLSEGFSSPSLPDMVAELEKHGLANLGGAVATPGGGASQLVNEGRAGIDPRSESVANPFSLPD